MRATTLDVPIADYRVCETGKVTEINPAGIHIGASYIIPLTPERLRLRYPTPQAYLAKVNQGSPDSAVAARKRPASRARSASAGTRVIGNRCNIAFLQLSDC